ncbi:probable salivary secreted peptide [Drosophila kikkawai]|uniref:Probable salivary secreted peptide n=1 Tax=Drosophila kikkawai TaxID=30033 RepID=A0A6P4IRZ2_DROKI|nr:probable salivary secreted peptide [Drosophila kikkawai]
MRSLLLLSLIILAVVLDGETYSLSFGDQFTTDIILFNKTVVRRPIEYKSWNVNVDFPCGGSINNYTITVIYVYDNFLNGSGAEPSLLRGGVGASEVTINLSGEVGHGINSTIEIWGF